MGFWQRFVEWHAPTVRSHAHIKTGHIAFSGDIPRFVIFFLAICRILCYSVRGATGTPVGGSPLDFSPGGNPLYLPPINIERGLTDMYVSWNDLFAFCTIILTVILVVYQMTNKEK